MTKKSKTSKKSKSKPAVVARHPVSWIDQRKKLLAEVAGSVAAGLVAAPSPSISTPSSMATVAVDIAEEILKKAGIAADEAAAESSPPEIASSVGAAS